MTALMIQGTSSDAGKSTLVTGLCRLFKRQGIRIAPFKSQNMALNSAVTCDRGEIGRAQAIQAFAAGLQPHTDMNPVLLKPNSDTGSQVIIQGQSIGNMNARCYHAYKATAKQAVLQSYQRLSQQYEVILIEGAGSPAEINLRQDDIANMGLAEAIDCPVLLVADIERGGVFAQLYGTLKLLSPSEQARIKGFIINRFRGEKALLQPGIDWLEDHCQKPVLGVLPYLHDFHLEAEDSLNLGINPLASTSHPQPLTVIVPALPRLSNHTDFDPLKLHPDVTIQFITQGQAIPPADLIILPGSKSVRADLDWLMDNHWQSAIQKHLRYGGKVMGICGGFQMLGEWIDDPSGLEGEPGSQPGLCLLSMQTTLQLEKKLANCQGVLNFSPTVTKVTGYEIHLGISTGQALEYPAIIGDDHQDGAMSEDQQILGTYWHGLFDQPEACQALLQWAGLEQPTPFDYRKRSNDEIDRLADCIDQFMDIEQIFKLT